MADETAVRRLACRLFLLLVLGPALLARAENATVTVPVRLDYLLLNQLLLEQLFDTPDQSRELLDDPAGCNRVVVRDPVVSPSGNALAIVARVDARVGLGILGSCSELLDLAGSIGFTGRPVIEPGANAVRLEPESTWLVGPDGGKITSGPLWNLTDTAMRAFLGRFVLDLAPYTDSLQSLLPDVLPNRSRQQLQAIVESLALDGISVTPDSLDVSIAFAIEAEAQPPRPESPLSEEELQQWESRWQMMDALLVFAVKHYASSTGLQALRDSLLDLLIESRYRLRDALASPASREGDEIRAWFLETWEQLGPLVRSIALEQEGQAHLLWFSVLTATDALQALDRLGPGVGLDISTDGLRRLARLISDDQVGDVLRYDEAIDPELQRLFEQRFEPGPPEPSALRFDFSLVPSARAAAPAERLNRWAPGSDELAEYLPMVAQVLDQSAKNALGTSRLEPAQRELFRKLVFATAWQESCWRQYVVKNERLEPLRSGSGDVGLMQINERVWRGFYDLQQLRWDIKYNGNAGAEVLLDYLVKYAIRKGEHRQAGGLANLTWASYSAYNGGPSKVSRYRQSNVSAYEKKVDTAFWEKYRQVDKGNELGVAGCLGGDLSGPAQVAVTPKPTSPAPAASAKKTESAGKTAPPADAGERWVTAQRDSHFTLQLGAFSERAYAADFIARESLPAPVYVYAVRKGSLTQYLVLHGSFVDRAQAEPARQRFSRLKPWLRRFGDLRRAAAG